MKSLHSFERYAGRLFGGCSILYAAIRTRSRFFAARRDGYVWLSATPLLFLSDTLVLVFSVPMQHAGRTRIPVVFMIPLNNFPCLYFEVCGRYSRPSNLAGARMREKRMGIPDPCSMAEYRGKARSLSVAAKKT